MSRRKLPENILQKRIAVVTTIQKIIAEGLAESDADALRLVMKRNKQKNTGLPQDFKKAHIIYRKTKQLYFHSTN